AYGGRYAIRPEDVGELLTAHRFIKELVLLYYREAHVDKLLALLIPKGVGGLYVNGGQLAETRLDPFVVESIERPAELLAELVAGKKDLLCAPLFTGQLKERHQDVVICRTGKTFFLMGKDLPAALYLATGHSDHV